MDDAERAPDTDESLDTLRLLGHMYLRYGQADEALALLRALCLLAPGDTRARRSLVRAAILAGQTDEALRMIDQLRDEGDPSPVLWLLEGQALASVGRHGEAQSVLAQFTSLRNRASAPPPP